MAARSRTTVTRVAPRRAWLRDACARWYRPVWLFPLALILAGLVTWPYLPRWTPDFSGDPLYRLTADQLVLPVTHEWIPVDFANRLLHRLGDTPTLLNAELPEQLRQELLLEPWVAAVHSVQVRREGRVAIDLEWRRPVLMASTPRGMYALDAQGVLLPAEDFTAADISRFPVAVGITSLPNVPAGRLWSDAAVIAAARLAELLAPGQTPGDPWQRLGLSRILLPGAAAAGESRAEASGPYELETRGGSRIVWGAPPGVSTIEPSAEQKLGRLDYYLQQCGPFDGPQGPVRIDIRGPDAIYAGALSPTTR